MRRLGVCSDCQKSGLALDEQGFLLCHESYGKICTGSYMTPETSYNSPETIHDQVTRVTGIPEPK